VKGVPFREARLSGGASDGLARVDAALLQEGGELRATGAGGLRWGAALVPTPDFERPAEGSFTAKGFELSPLQPLVDGTLAKLEGKLDADLRYTQASRDPRTGKLRGSLALRDGVVDAVLVGQEFRDVRAKVSIDESGEIRLADASFRGSEGRATIEGTAHVAGPVLEDAVARVTIAKREMLPITYQGVDIGQAWGDIRVAAKTRADGVFALDVDVPRLQLEMPDTPTKSTQSLDAEPTVRIGTHLASAQSAVSPRFVTLPLGDPKKEETAPPDKPSEDPLVTERTVAAAEEAGSKKAAPPPTKGGVVVHVTLGPEIRLYKSNQLDLYVKGTLDASTLEDKVAVAGLINAERGWVEVQGRRFSVERATVSFDPDRSPSDPTIAATALYVAPDTTRVFADFIGTVANGRLKLRSEPALSQSEILSLVVFGQREGATAGSGAGQKASSTNRAASLGGGVVTQGLNKALSSISPVEITTRIDTTSSQNPRPEVGVAVTKDVSAAVSFRTGLPTPGQAPDRSLLKLDYRFRPRWSIDTTLGDRGTSIVDLTWKYRY
jgi:translocation and assembly module TamB